MRHFILILFSLFCSCLSLTSQVSINNSGLPPDPSSVLDLQHAGKGLLVPRMTKSARDVMPSPANSLLIFQTDNSPGYYYNDGTPVSPVWKALVSSDNNALSYKILITSLPYNITQAGSYLVIKDLQGLGGITVNTSNVTIDLNFFTLTGAAGNTSEGIKVVGTQTNINVLNGSVRDWNEGGIIAPNSSNGQFLNLNLISNGDDGLNAGSNNIISNCVAFNNSFDGIDSDVNCTISNCTVSNNGDNGIETEQNCVIQHCTSKSNLAAGIRSGNNSVINNCSSTANTFSGIETGDGSKVSDCTASLNGTSGFVLANASLANHNVSRNNTSHGYLCFQDVTLKGNIADSNTQNGFHSTFDGGKMDENNSTDNAIGYFISGSSWLVTRNTANNNTGGGFSIGPSNTVATIITSANINTNTNPFANINF
ncbi:MAG: right-handed parallel beta-helix repeat-containing protein [Saprospiraceae bacterium]|nr:right-handed parallel beta-helix repeat-containing protein [Saprospiraceae bacterium]